jgi:hypothetical protein
MTHSSPAPFAECRGEIDSLSIPKQLPQPALRAVRGGTITATPDIATIQNFELSDFSIGTSLELLARQTRATAETPSAPRASTFAPLRFTEEYDESP